MTSDGNGKVRFSLGNAIAVWLAVIIPLVAATIGSHFWFAIDVKSNLATLNAVVSSHASKILVNKEDIRETRTDLKQHVKHK